MQGAGQAMRRRNVGYTVMVRKGGKHLLSNRIASKEEQWHWYQQVPYLKMLRVKRWTLVELECIATGVFSPLTGFMNQQDYESVVEELRLADGQLWPIPITLPITTELGEWLEVGEPIAIADENGKVYAILQLEEKYRPNKMREAERVYGTTDVKHPGVKRIFQQPELYIGGSIILLRRPMLHAFSGYHFTPSEIQEMKAERNWQTMVAFQTRNPIHRAHEYLMKVALESVDGLLLHPLVGETKADDLPASIRMKCYETMVEHYFPQERIILSLFPANMHYAGPREAMLHALARKNYGCTHLIVGRDHAGVGDYYDPYAAHRLLQEYEKELGIIPLCFEASFFCQSCGQMATSKTCPHDSRHHHILSGTAVRQLLKEKKELPQTFSRPEVAHILLADGESKFKQDSQCNSELESSPLQHGKSVDQDENCHQEIHG